MKMYFDVAELEPVKEELREAICDLLLKEPFMGMGHVAVSEALVASAFAWRDFNGGEADTRHAANCLHELVDRIMEEKIG